jgi:hypothetical protein
MPSYIISYIPYERSACILLPVGIRQLHVTVQLPVSRWRETDSPVKTGKTKSNGKSLARRVCRMLCAEDLLRGMFDVSYTYLMFHVKHVMFDVLRVMFDVSYTYLMWNMSRIHTWYISFISHTYIMSRTHTWYIHIIRILRARYGS